MTIQDRIVQMIFDRFGKTDRDLAHQIEKEARADERERCIQAANNVHNPVQCVSTPAFLRIRNDIIKAIKAE